VLRQEEDGYGDPLFVGFEFGLGRGRKDSGGERVKIKELYGRREGTVLNLQTEMKLGRDSSGDGNL